MYSLIIIVLFTLYDYIDFKITFIKINSIIKFIDIFLLSQLFFYGAREIKWISIISYMNIHILATNISKIILEFSSYTLINPYKDWVVLDLLIKFSLIWLIKLTMKNKYLVSNKISLVLFFVMFVYNLLYFEASNNIPLVGPVDSNAIHISILVFSMMVLFDYLYYKSSIEYELKKQRSEIVENNRVIKEKVSLVNKSLHDLKNRDIGLLFAEDEERTRLLKENLRNISSYKNYSSNDIIDYIINASLDKVEISEENLEINCFLANDLATKDTDLSILFGNIMDNASKALLSLDYDNRYMKIEVRQIDGILIIKVKNSYCPRSYRKGKGIGSRSIKDIVETYDGLYKAIKKDDFYQVIITI